ncbi:hypothetical protein HYFRA_00004455 [Hymenoscyphus fraxineus]|uniref:Uncharacterized protein n=1 Tax=Hymenoscyphus fraxineus TaxID=746836 RepID=A0A9N9KYQ6_9HELO|nr:hypothetical protein HYFRA_00004455 [Hymenoscyphus fraxineus]
MAIGLVASRNGLFQEFGRYNILTGPSSISEDVWAELCVSLTSATILHNLLSQRTRPLSGPKRSDLLYSPTSTSILRTGDQLVIPSQQTNLLPSRIQEVDIDHPKASFNLIRDRSVCSCTSSVLVLSRPESCRRLLIPDFAVASHPQVEITPAGPPPKKRASPSVPPDRVWNIITRLAPPTHTSPVLFSFHSHSFLRCVLPHVTSARGTITFLGRIGTTGVHRWMSCKWSIFHATWNRGHDPSSRYSIAPTLQDPDMTASMEGFNASALNFSEPSLSASMSPDRKHRLLLPFSSHPPSTLDRRH